MGRMTLDDRYYYGACGTRAVAASPHTSDEPSDITGPLLLPPTVVMDYMTSDDLYYYWARGSAWLLLAPTVAMGVLTSVARSHWHPTIAMG
jgi:hypothetical protein